MSSESEDVRITKFKEAERRLWNRYDLSPEKGTVSLEDLGEASGSGRSVRGRRSSFSMGGTGVGSTWVSLIDHVEGRRCIVVDRSGCGLSDPVDYHSIDPRRYSTDVIAGLLDELGVDSTGSS